MRYVPDSFGAELEEFNPCHNPPGPGGGQFCSGSSTAQEEPGLNKPFKPSSYRYPDVPSIGEKVRWLPGPFADVREFHWAQTHEGPHWAIGEVVAVQPRGLLPTATVRFERYGTTEEVTRPIKKLYRLGPRAQEEPGLKAGPAPFGEGSPSRDPYEVADAAREKFDRDTPGRGYWKGVEAQSIWRQAFMEASQVYLKARTHEAARLLQAAAPGLDVRPDSGGNLHLVIITDPSDGTSLSVRLELGRKGQAHDRVHVTGVYGGVQSTFRWKKDGPLSAKKIVQTVKELIPYKRKEVRAAQLDMLVKQDEQHQLAATYMQQGIDRGQAYKRAYDEILARERAKRGW